MALSCIDFLYMHATIAITVDLPPSSFFGKMWVDFFRLCLRKNLVLQKFLPNYFKLIQHFPKIEIYTAYCILKTTLIRKFVFFCSIFVDNLYQSVVSIWPCVCFFVSRIVRFFVMVFAVGSVWFSFFVSANL